LRLNVDGERDPAISGWALVIRALGLRCPRCGRGRIFGSHFRMNDNCFECGATFWKNDGEWLGPAVADYTMATAAGLVAWAVLVLLGASSTLQLVLAGLATVVIALAFSRFTRSFWTMLLYISGDMADTPSQARNP
ncbi:MAG TPA: DUF983 domain-containing protein, partial [Candidatus Binataceae bacterium]|nr:DUF983 domain-containing protein [Candidatus Binataceae bacterium]